MPRQRSTTVQGSPAGAAETVIAILSGLSYSPSDVIDLEATVDLTVGTAGVTATLNIRRGTTTGGALVQGYGPFTVVAANRVNLTINATDSQGGEFANANYVLTLTVGSASAVSTVNNVYFNALY